MLVGVAVEKLGLECLGLTPTVEKVDQALHHPSFQENIQLLLRPLFKSSAQDRWWLLGNYIYFYSLSFWQVNLLVGSHQLASLQKKWIDKDRYR